MLRASLNNAVREELISRNVAALIRVPKLRRRKVKQWSADEARVLRHSQISVTMNIYSEVSSDATRRALKRLGKRLDTER